MTMPKWHEMMQPVLGALAENETLTSSELAAVLEDRFSLTQDEKAERLASGQLRYMNRMYWAITDLRKAALIENGGKRGVYRITSKGREFAMRHDAPFTANDLMRESEEFRQWKQGYLKKEQAQAKVAHESPIAEREDEASPQEVMQAAYDEMRDALADEILQSIMHDSPGFFEYLVGKLLAALGYGESEDDVKVTPQSGDEGIDGVVKEDRLGFDNVYYQAKRWEPESTVGRPAIQAFVGALSGKGGTKGLFITTASFSKAARAFAEGLTSQKLVLIDGRQLAGLMIDYGVGVSTVDTFEVKAVDTDFFDEER